MKFVKGIRYAKFAFAVLFFELMLGRICYEYGYARAASVEGIWTMYLFAAYGVIYICICVLQGKGETDFGINVFSTIMLGVPFIGGIIVSCVFANNSVDMPFAIVLIVVLGIELVLEAVILGLHVRRDKQLEKKYRNRAAS